MPNLNAKILINAPCQIVYDISQDYAVRFDWDPFPDTLEMLGGASYEPRLGGLVFVRGKWGLSMVVEFIQLLPPQRAAIKMIRGPWFLAVFAGSWIFHEVCEKTSRVEFTYTLKLKNLPFKTLFETLASAYFARVSRQRLQGLKRYCEQNHS
jgi:hypothetical protein